MNRFLVASAALVLLTVAGCAGGEGCAAVVETVGNSRYAGAYTATYVPATGGAPALSFTLNIDANGQVNGDVTDAGLSTVSEVDGRVGNYKSGCSVSGTSASLILSDGTITVGSLTAYRDQRNSITGSYTAYYLLNGVATNGTLTITTAGG